MSLNKKYKKGFSLIELLIAIIVLGILATMIFNSGAKAQERARITSALTVLEDYNTAFSNTCMNHPGIMKSREDSWNSLTGYKTEDAFSLFVNYMNESLDNKTKFIWDSSLGLYRSQGEDPWGGYFILVEYPYETVTSDGYDPTTGLGLSAMRCSIWCTGNDNGILVDRKVSSKSVGGCFSFKNGDVSCAYHGVNGATPYTGYILQWN